jgi:curved DNA-binding protein CbpA
VSPNPFAALGLPERPDLDDETVRAAWRQIAAATHPDRADGGDLARYTQASAAYAELRSPWGRSEAYADLAEQARRAGRLDDESVDDDDDDEPATAPLPAVPGETLLPPDLPRAPLVAVLSLPSRIRRGRPLRLLIRAATAAALGLGVLALIPGAPAAPADVVILVTWFALTARRDLAPPPER